MIKTNKFIEYSVFNTHEQYEIQDFIFRAIKIGVAGIVLPPAFLSEFAQLIPDGINIATVIDYPCGFEHTSVRQHAISSALNRGAKSVDLVAPHFFLLNKKPIKFKDDIKACLDTCLAKDGTLRVMLDYRLIRQTKEIDEVCYILKELGIQYILPSTGFFVDEFWDNLIISDHIEDTHKISTITNGNIYSEKHFESALKCQIFGLRINSITALERLLI